jgi:hypothetical protein
MRTHSTHSTQSGAHAHNGGGGLGGARVTATLCPSPLMQGVLPHPHPIPTTTHAHNAPSAGSFHLPLLPLLTWKLPPPLPSFPGLQAPPTPTPPADLEAALRPCPRHLPHIVGHPHHVGGVQRSVHLVEHEEGGGLIAAAGGGREGGGSVMPVCQSASWGMGGGMPVCQSAS